jgi:hypothetical protein
MGYQIVEATFDDFRVKEGICLNAEIVAFPEDEPDRKLLVKASFNELLEFADKAPTYHLREIRVISRAALTGPHFHNAMRSNPAPRTGASSQPIKISQDGDVFKRFSAYENDRRITPNKGLSPGSYATTDTDARVVLAGKQAVSRYALPNKRPAVNVFTIKPPVRTTLQTGIVEPAYGEPGGGVEVLFRDGTADRTVTGPTAIPEG